MASPPVSNVAEVSKLCVDCGLCCSDAIFDHAALADGEADFVRSIGMGIINVDHEAPGKQAIEFPCPHLSGTACSIYDRPRPKICSSFFCELAHGLDRGDISLSDAKDKVGNAHALLDQMRPLLREGENWRLARARWLRDKHERFVSPANATLHMLMTTINLLYDRHFRPKDKRWISFDEGD